MTKTINDKGVKLFIKYVLDFYGKDGLYPNDLGWPVTREDVLEAYAIFLLACQLHDYGMGDSLDRERVRDIMIKTKDPKKATEFDWWFKERGII